MLKVSTLFITLIVVIRLLGKSAFAQLTPHDFATIIFISYLAISPVKPTGMIEAIISIILVATIYMLIGKLSLLQPFNHLIIGKPTILVKDGKIIKSNLKASRFTLIELLSSLRTSGYRDIENIEYVILEPDGQLSILPRVHYSPLTPNDLNIKKEYKGLPIIVIADGKIHKNNLQLIDKTEEWLKKELQLKGYSSIKDIFYATVRESDHYLYIDNGKYE